MSKANPRPEMITSVLTGVVGEYFVAALLRPSLCGCFVQPTIGSVAITTNSGQLFGERRYDKVSHLFF